MKFFAPAKINLSLRIGQKYPDGYHAIETVMQTLCFGDELEITSTKDGKIILIVEKSPWKIPVGEENLIICVAKLLKITAGKQCFENAGAKIILHKKIPLQAGLGGGSSDAAITLVALNKLWKLNFTIRKLSKLAIQLGSDVPFFLVGGRAKVSGRGEQVRKLKSLPKQLVVLVKPKFGIDTREAYEEWDRLKESRIKNQDDKISKQILNPKSYILYPKFLNDFEQVVFSKYPSLARWRNYFLEKGTNVTGLCGSGSTIFAMFDSQKKILDIEQELKKQKVWWTITKTM